MDTAYRAPGPLRPVLRQLVIVSCPPLLRELDLIEETVAETELFMSSLAPWIRFGMASALAVLELSAPLSPAHLGKRFSQLDRQQATRHFERLWSSGLPLAHAMAKALKASVTQGFYELRPVKQKLGYVPEPWIAAVAKRRLERYGPAIREHERMLFERDPLVATKPADREAAAAGDPRSTHAAGGLR